MTRFRQIMDNFKLQASEHEFGLLNRRFQAKAANEINYVEFDYVLRQYSGDLEKNWKKCVFHGTGRLVEARGIATDIQG